MYKIRVVINIGKSDPSSRLKPLQSLSAAFQSCQGLTIVSTAQARIPELCYNFFFCTSKRDPKTRPFLSMKVTDKPPGLKGRVVAQIPFVAHRSDSAPAVPSFMGTKRDASYKKYANEIKYCFNYSAEKPEVRHYRERYIYIKIYTYIVNRIQLIYKDI